MEIVKKDLMKAADVEKAKILQGFFKTGKGDYGEGDVFLGLTAKEIKDVAKKYSWISLDEIVGLLKSDVHEERVCALRILVGKYASQDNREQTIENRKKEIYDFYLGHTRHVNNWDLVDLSAPKIVGSWLLDKNNRSVLDGLAVSDNLWERRIAIVSTFAFIRAGEFDDTLRIAKVLLGDGHDLIHKAVGWMLREVGKRDVSILKEFLRENYSDLPRTTLRYAIERFPEDLRVKYLKGNYEGH